MLNNSILKKNDNDVVSSREVNKKLRVSVIYIYKIAYKSLLDYFFKFFIKKKKKASTEKITNCQATKNRCYQTTFTSACPVIPVFPFC